MKHQQKLEQCLRLRNFEQNFREVRTSWWQSIFGNIEMIQKMLPALDFTVLVCTCKLSPTFFLCLPLLDTLLSLLVWIHAYRDITFYFFFYSLRKFFSMHPAVYKHSKTSLKPALYHRNIKCCCNTFILPIVLLWNQVSTKHSG